MNVQRVTFETMGTVASLATPDPDLTEMADVAAAMLAEADRRFSPYRADSELTRLQRDPTAAARMSDAMREVLTTCDNLERLTEGAFRPYDRAGQVETTGFVKGWAMGCVGSALRERGWLDWCLTVGGDVLAAGNNGERPWHVAVRHPARPGAVADVFAVSDAAVATSGDYERGHHIWGRHPDTRGGSVTVVGPDIAIADALATALWAQTETSPPWLSRFPEYGVLHLDAAGARRAA